MLAWDLYRFLSRYTDKDLKGMSVEICIKNGRVDKHDLWPKIEGSYSACNKRFILVCKTEE